MKLGTVTYLIAAKWDVPTIIKNLREAKFDGVELRTTHAHKVEVDLNDDQRRQVRKQFEDAGIEIAGLGSAFEYHSTDPAEVRRQVEGTKEYIELAHDLGCVGVKVRPNGVNTDKGVPLDVTLRQIGAALHEVGEFGERFGVHVRVEVHGRVTAELPHMKKIMDYARHPNVYVCWNSNDSDLDKPARPGDPASIEKNFKLVADKVIAVHMRDLYVNYPWRQLFALLRQAQFDGYCFAEIPGCACDADAVRVLHYYRALWRALSSEAAA
jgi:sugar phosphate isomerase/epimerase